MQFSDQSRYINDNIVIIYRNNLYIFYIFGFLYFNIYSIYISLYYILIFSRTFQGDSESNQIKSNQKVLFKVGTFYNSTTNISSQELFKPTCIIKLHKLNTAQQTCHAIQD